MMDTINESEDKIIAYDPKLSINSPTSPSPMSSLSNTIKSHSATSHSGDNEILSRDLEFPTDEHPSLHPKYTNETSRSSIITCSARSSANSAILANNNGNNSNPWFKDNLPKINAKNKSNNSLSSKLIYDNMDKYKYQSQPVTQNGSNSLNQQFAMIEDDEDDIDDHDFDHQPFEDSDDDDDEYYPTETEFVSVSEEDEGALFSDDGALSPLSTMMAPPTLTIDCTNIDNLLTTEQGSQETQYEEYDEDGDHNTSIPVEFRKLQLSQSFNDTHIDYGM